MKRPAKSNYETVVVECSDFNQIAFNPPDPSKSVLIKTEQQRANKKQGKKNNIQRALQEGLEYTNVAKVVVCNRKAMNRSFVRMSQNQHKAVWLAY